LGDKTFMKTLGIYDLHVPRLGCISGHRLAAPLQLMPFTPNQKVQLANDTTKVGMVEALGPLHSGIQYYKVFWGGEVGTRTVGELDLVPHTDQRSPHQLLEAGRLAGYPEFQRLITLQRLVREEPLRNNIYAFNASRTRFFPYQFKPLLKFLESGRHRLLICDEVGLGKTIEAGLILLELRARQSLRLVLVICPANLRHKWRLELKHRFGEDFAIMGAKEFRGFLEEYRERPDRVSLSGIVSLETVRTQSVAAQLEELDVAFDLVIVDEAHHLRNFGTAQRNAAEVVVRPAQSVVMLTATPVHLGQQNLFSLLNLLDEEDFPDQESSQQRFTDNEFIVQAQSAIARTEPDLDSALSFLEQAQGSRWLERRPLLRGIRDKIALIRNRTVNGKTGSILEILDIQRDLADLNLLGHILTRTRKRDVHEHVAIRRAQSREIAFSPQEQDFYDTVTELIRKENEQREEGAVISRWRLNTPQRRMASSLQGMVEYYREHFRGAASQPDEEDDLDWEPGDAVEELSEGALRRRLYKLVEQWPPDGPDGKYDALRDLLSRLGHSDRTPKVLIFATFKHTLRYIHRRLRADGFQSVLISGDTPMDERPEAIRRFREDENVGVLLSSRVGSEGLDFQFCSTMVNYDLPWNPMEVEQRIGRLDRIGQTAPSILIVNLWTLGTIEERILRRLYDRIGIFERSIGDLEAILGDVTQELQEQLLRATLNPEEAEAALERSVRVVQDRRAQLEKLEQSAARFVGADAFFDNEVAAIRSNRRFVTGEQLRRFLSDFLSYSAPGTRLEYDSAAKTGFLAPDEALRDFMRRSGRIGDLLNIAGAVGDRVAITFDAETAYQRPGVEFLSVVHPLIIAIAEHLHSGEAIGSAHHVALDTAALSEGFYFYFVYRIRIRAARSYAILEAVVLDSKLDCVLRAEEAERLLGEMVESGRSPDFPVEFEAGIVSRAVQIGEETLLTHLSKLKAAESVANEAFVEQRLASLRAFYEKAIRKKKELLDRGVADGRQERYLRMLRGHATRLESEFQLKAAELDNLRVVTTEHEPIAAGILEVARTSH
jgi:ATP-dependent helicase HepA